MGTLMLGRQETEKLCSSGITFVVALNNETNGILNLNCDREMRIHGIACHVSEFVDNGGVHNLVVTVAAKDAGFNHHGRKKGSRQFCIARNRQCQRKRFVHVSFHCVRFKCIFLHTSSFSGNRFGRGTRFAHGTFCHVHAGKTKERQFGLDDLLVPSVQHCMAWGPALNLTANTFNWKGR